MVEALGVCNGRLNAGRFVLGMAGWPNAVRQSRRMGMRSFMFSKIGLSAALDYLSASRVNGIAEHFYKCPVLPDLRRTLLGRFVSLSVLILNHPKIVCVAVRAARFIDRVRVLLTGIASGALPS